MDRREDVLQGGEVEQQYEVKYLTRALLEGCEILFFQHLNFSDTIVSSFGLIPERALASNLLLFYFIIACILTFKRNQEISGE